ncbi:phage tail sheath protein FI [Pseudanabaena sp. lw0831]|uniref:phage tail sheath C-terminal domain-containing protein n=1 Tax=Pseudanabaena sp. lw0831 TaxID=1357935 RepID=UPI001A20FB59|nr:phage tail sheath C-terminal domain-containing protein [Pseudanabaena sp. lw0831]GBO55803.1 phage tail sheath protein FI [Pseudanabaena sp. lw0831]
MPTYKTPDVYIEEISVFPPSVAEVETAIPAFIGYTQKAIRNAPNDLNLKPTKIYSLKEYETYYGYPKEDPLTITVVNDGSSGLKVDPPFTDPTLNYLMYYSLKMFFDNGGGQCYIISVGNYPSDSTTKPQSSELTKGLNELRLEDEPTLIIIPEAVKLSTAEYTTLVQAVLKQCNDLRDRFAIFDLYNGDKNLDETTAGASSNYLVSNRDYFGSNYLKYGAVYYPFLKTTLNFYVNDDETTVMVTPPPLGSGSTATATLASGVVNAINITAGGSGYTSSPSVNIAAPPAGGVQATATATLASGVVNAINITAGGSGYTSSPSVNIAAPPAGGVQATATVTLASGVVNAINITASGSGYTSSPSVNIAAPPAGGVQATATVTLASGVVNAINITAGGSGYTSPPSVSFIPATPAAANLASFRTSNTALYNFVKSILKEHFVILPPSGAVAGIYAATDSNRGVWKAPANVSLANVIEPVIKLDNDKQDGLNVDATTGKSINAIRAFMGKGTLVWGARTLAGNDNEWRYVPVRRFFSVVEESVKKSTYWAVFEPNDANTWVKVRGMIENYLTQKWREGALAGATPKEAFFVKCGLGITMTAIDILEGRMNVEIGMAVVRPAEFIILKFSHKLQTS